MEEIDFTEDIISTLKSFKSKSKNISEEEKSKIKYHDCGHDNGTKCVNVIEVL